MKKYIKKITARILLILMIIQPTAPILAAVVTLPTGTTVQCELRETVTAAGVTSGQSIRMAVRGDVMKDGEVVIRGGTDVLATVVSATKPAMLGKPGEIGITIKSTKAVDGTTINLSASRVAKGQDKQTMSIVIGLFLCIFALFMKGEDGSLQAGSIIDASTVSEVQINT